MAYSEGRTEKGESLLLVTGDYVVVDIETTGLSPESCEIIEIAAVKVRDGEEIRHFQTLLKPKNPISGFITGLTGITNQMVACAPTAEAVLPAFLDFVGDEILIGHNVNFDINFLYDNCMRFLGVPLRNDYIDTMRLCKRLFPGESHYRLSDLEQRFGLHNEKAHRALSDVRLTDGCYRYMCRHIREHGIVLNEFTDKSCLRPRE